LEDVVYAGLQLLEEEGVIKKFADLRDRDTAVRKFSSLERTLAYPDFWVLLFNSTEIEIEVKNLGLNMKDYVKNPGDTPYWAYSVRWLQKSILDKRWTPGAKKFLVVSMMAVFTEAAKEKLRNFTDSIIEIGLQVKDRDPQGVEALWSLIDKLRDEFKRVGTKRAN